MTLARIFFMLLCCLIGNMNATRIGNATNLNLDVTIENTNGPISATTSLMLPGNGAIYEPLSQGSYIFEIRTSKSPENPTKIELYLKTDDNILIVKSGLTYDLITQSKKRKIEKEEAVPAQKVTDQQIMNALGVSKLPATPEQILHVRKGAAITELNSAFLDLKDFWEHTSDKDLVNVIGKMINDSYIKLSGPANAKAQVRKAIQPDPAQVFTRYNHIFSQDLKRMKLLYKINPVVFKSSNIIQNHIQKIKASIIGLLTEDPQDPQYSIPYWLKQFPMNEQMIDIETQFRSLLTEFQKLNS